tara:strand:+ start:335 stop:502 length:168 start_codon:yes stop_codon:yes gene_type:complete
MYGNHNQKPEDDNPGAVILGGLISLLTMIPFIYVLWKVLNIDLYIKTFTDLTGGK